jgi:hypothetical protein
MKATVPHVTSGLGLRKFQTDGFLLTRVYDCYLCYMTHYMQLRTFTLYKDRVPEYDHCW